MKKIIAVMFILCLLLPFGACKKEPIAVKKRVAERAQPIDVKKEQAQAEEAKSPFQGTYYAYDQLGRRDPFLSLIKIAKKRPPKKKGATPLESFDVEEIEILAIASDKNESYALVVLPNKKTYTIKKGTVLGLQEGKVEEITDDKVVIREYVKDYRGDIQPKDTVLKLHKGEE